jgi:hypothetical protein
LRDHVPDLGQVLPEDVIPFEPLLNLPDDHRGVHIHARREVDEFLFRKRVHQVFDEDIELPLRDEEGGRGIIRNPFRSWERTRVGRGPRTDVDVDSRLISSIAAQHVLDLVSEDEPEVVEPVKS